MSKRDNVEETWKVEKRYKKNFTKKESDLRFTNSDYTNSDL
jgi:hypothetical protein